MLPTESAGRFAAPLPPAAGEPTCFATRPPPSARAPPALMRGPPGRLPGPPPFGVGPRPPFHLPPGHPRMDPRWSRPRHLGGGYLVTPNGVQPPPPPMAAGPGIRSGRKSITHLETRSVGSFFLCAFCRATHGLWLRWRQRVAVNSVTKCVFSPQQDKLSLCRHVHGGQASLSTRPAVQ